MEQSKICNKHIKVRGNDRSSTYVWHDVYMVFSEVGGNMEELIKEIKELKETANKILEILIFQNSKKKIEPEQIKKM